MYEPPLVLSSMLPILLVMEITFLSLPASRLGKNVWIMCMGAMLLILKLSIHSSIEIWPSWLPLQIPALLIKISMGRCANCF